MFNNRQFTPYPLTHRWKIIRVGGGGFTKLDPIGSF